MKQYNVSLYLDLPQKTQILVLVNTLGDTKAVRHINIWHWRKRQSGSETTFLIGTKFHRQENNAELEGFFHSNLIAFL